jgi:hypothetical protein
MSALVASAVAMSLAAAAGPPAAAEDPCAEDVQRLCPGVKAGGGRVTRCLRDRLDGLSAACRAKLDAGALEARRVVEAFGRACRADVEQYCADVEPGRGRVLGCLAQHQIEVSSPCQAELGRFAEARERIEALKEACAGDVQNLCPEVPPQAGPLLECLQANEARLSPACSPAEVRRASEAASIVDTVEEMTRQDRVREALQVLQGVDSVAFSRSQVLLQFDSYEGLAGRASASRVLFNPQFAFGARGQLALQVKVPVKTIYPSAAGAPTQSGLGEITTTFAWNVASRRQVRHFLSLGLQADTADQAALGAPWALQSAYAVATALARWVSVTAQVVWIRSVGSTGSRPEVDVLLLEPIVVANLPGRSFLSLDTKLSWDLVDATFVPVMKGVAGIFTDRQKSVSISAWYQASLTHAAISKSFDRAVGLGLAYYFDW